MAQLMGLETALRKTASLNNSVISEQKKHIKRALMIIEKQAKDNVRNLKAQSLKSDALIRNHGILMSSISHRLLDTKTGEVGAMGTKTHYAKYFEFGTGIAGKAGESNWSYLDKTPPQYAPSGRWIKPKRGRFLSWIDPESGERVFALKTKGQPPKPFLRLAVWQTKGRVVEELEKAHRQLVSRAII